MHTAKISHLPVMLVVLVLLSTCAPISAPVSVPTDTPQPFATHTPVPTSTPSPTSTPHVTSTLEQGAGYEFRAWVALELPGWDNPQTVYGKLTKEDEGVAGAQMYCIVHYGNIEQRWPDEGFETTKDNGIAAVSFDIVNVGLGAAVPVDVYIVYGGETFHSVTSFTARC